MDKYIINENTLMIIGSENGSTILEDKNKFFIGKLSTKIVDESCLFYGSSFVGRVDGTKNMIGISYKCPIIVSESKGIIVFPTCSFRENECTWIVLGNVENYYNNNKNLAIFFKNGVKININLSVGVFDKQILRATRLLSVLNARKR